MYNGIIFDLDNTLYQYEPCHEHALEKTFAYIQKITNLNIEIISKTFHTARSEINSELKGTASSHNRLLYFQRFFEILTLSPFPYAQELYQLYWDTFLDKIQLFDGVLELLFSLREKKIKIGILTDLTADIQHRKINHLKLNNLIDYFVTSEEIGAEKPSPKAFEKILSKMGIKDVNKIAMVGDNYHKDILGATSLGIKSFYINQFKPNEENPNVIWIKNIRELKERLSKA